MTLIENNLYYRWSHIISLIIWSNISHSNSNRFTYVSVSIYDHRQKSSYHEAAVYVTSKRGTQLVFYDGNTYTPNEKSYPGQGSRNWKCSQYYKSKCKARVITREINNRDVIRSAITEHTHPKMYPQHSNIYSHSQFSLLERSWIYCQLIKLVY